MPSVIVPDNQLVVEIKFAPVGQETCTQDNHVFNKPSNHWLQYVECYCGLHKVLAEYDRMRAAWELSW